jgi:hypothetical protein
MNQPRPFPGVLVLFASLVVACSTRVPPGAIAWNDRTPVIVPPADEAKRCEGSLGSLGFLSFETDESKGCLRVYTDTNEIVNGSLSYTNVRRSFDLYTPDGTLIQAGVNNQGGRYGEEPVSLPLAPGRYVVASMYGATYRKVQVEVRAGATTDVSASALREASPVFAQ